MKRSAADPPALAERLLATAPDGLDRVLFVNSGSEANDLALRLGAWEGRLALAYPVAADDATSILIDERVLDELLDGIHLDEAAPAAPRRTRTLMH